MVKGTQTTEVWEEMQEGQRFLIVWRIKFPYKNFMKADDLPLYIHINLGYKSKDFAAPLKAIPWPLRDTQTPDWDPLSYTVTSSKAGTGPFPSLYPRYTGDAQKCLHKKSMNCTSNPLFFFSRGPQRDLLKITTLRQKPMSSDSQLLH